MVEYRDIRELVRHGRHAGTAYTVKVRADDSAERYTLQGVEFHGGKVVNIGETFDHIDHAFDMGHACAKATIDSKD